MSDTNQLIELVSSGDPIVGKQALYDLLALGDKGEETFFSRRIVIPELIQAKRRWLQYVASREKTIIDRLIDRLQNQDNFKDGRYIALLFAGTARNREAIIALHSQLESGFERAKIAYRNQYIPTDQMFRDYDPFYNRFLAWGYAGGDANTLWHYVQDSDYAWEKLKVSAFTASCATVARMNGDNLWAIEQLITHEWQDTIDSLVKIGDLPNAVSNQALGDADLDFATSWGAFITWRRGEIADEILQRWSQQAHWRVRYFGAQILASLGFQRTVSPVIGWLRRESIPQIRRSLLHALERSEAVSGADALIENFNSSSQEEDEYVARVAWRASNKHRAIEALNEIAGKKGSAGAEALVSLARLGHKYSRLEESLDSTDEYRRLNAALALAYLGEQKIVDRLVSMQREVATSFERIFLAAALAILGYSDAVIRLHKELVAGADLPDIKRVDIFFMKRYLQRAIIEGLGTAGSQANDYCSAWQAELEPLEPVPQPIKFGSKSQSGPPLILSPQREQVPVGNEASVIRVFVSYSHQDKKYLERTSLLGYLSGLEREGFVFWRDSSIQAGDLWDAAIKQQLQQADIALALVSQSFLNSRYCLDVEVKSFLEKRKESGMVIFPVILSPCDWESHAWLAATQYEPREGRAIERHYRSKGSRDELYLRILKQLREIGQRIRSGR